MDSLIVEETGAALTKFDLAVTPHRTARTPQLDKHQAVSPRRQPYHNQIPDDRMCHLPVIGRLSTDRLPTVNRHKHQLSLLHAPQTTAILKLPRNQPPEHLSKINQNRNKPALWEDSLETAITNKYPLDNHD